MLKKMAGEGGGVYTNHKCEILNNLFDKNAQIQLAPFLLLFEKNYNFQTYSDLALFV